MKTICGLTRTGLCLVLVGMGTVLAHALEYKHEGIPEPTMEGFTLNANAAYTWVDAQTTPPAGQLISSNIRRACYYVDLTADDFDNPGGWEVSSQVWLISNRVIVTETELLGYNSAIEVMDGQDLWAMHFVGGPDIEPGIYASGALIYGNTWEKISLETSVDPTDGFHTYKMVYNPAGDGGNGMVTFFVDDVEVGTQTRAQAYNHTLYRFGFGDFASGSGTGVAAPASNTIWALAQMETEYAPPLFLPGDADRNNTVDAADAVILAANWLSTDNVSWGKGDFNYDGIVDDADATFMATNWGKSVPSGAASAPEPAAWALLASLLLTAAMLRRKGIATK